VTALRRLLSGIVDYAGLFPPAALDLAAAVRNYAEYRASSDAWMLGRFIIDVGRLDEFSAVLHERSDSGEWRLSALAGPEFEADVARCVAFNAANAGRASVDTLETKLASPAAIACAAGATAGGFTLFVEVPIDRDPILLIQAIADARMNAKVRMGGVTAEAFPAASDVVRFMRRCGDAGVPFKATAGLHHPLRAKYRLTYASDAPRGEMYGYLNVFLAAAMLDLLSDAEAVALLEERDPEAILMRGDAVRWRGHAVGRDTIEAARRGTALSFGSCSFREPVDEVHALPFSFSA
jgi:hypothetical protein